MIELERKIRPSLAADPWPRDMLAVGLLVFLGAAILPAWTAGQDRFLNDVAGQMAGSYLLMAMGFLLALRAGVVDLSVWGVSCAGGMASAWLMNTGVSPAVAVVSGIVLGGAIGAVNGLGAILPRVSGTLVTLAMALAIVILAQAVLPQHREVRVGDNAFSHWQVVRDVKYEDDNGQATGGETHTMPLAVTRMLLVVGCYATVMFVLLVGNNLSRPPADPLLVARAPRPLMSARWNVFVSLCASGALSAAGGVFWLVEYGSAPVPTNVIEDLRVPAAALLAGGVFLAGANRTLLAVLVLPAAMLLATVWRQEVWNLNYRGVPLQLVLLLGMVIVIHLSMNTLLERARKRAPAAVAAGLCCAGLLLVALSAWAGGGRSRSALHAAGVAVWAAGAVLLVVVRVSRARKSRETSLFDRGEDL